MSQNREQFTFNYKKSDRDEERFQNDFFDNFRFNQEYEQFVQEQNEMSQIELLEKLEKSVQKNNLRKKFNTFLNNATDIQREVMSNEWVSIKQNPQYFDLTFEELKASLNARVYFSPLLLEDEIKIYAEEYSKDSIILINKNGKKYKITGDDNAFISNQH